MKPWFVFVALLCTGASACGIGAQGTARTDGPLTPDEALASFELEPGYRIELAAAEPLIRDPVAMAFDERGRLYVVENRGYPGPLEGAPPPPPQGVIALLEDRNGDGRFDTRVDFAGSLTYPNGIMPWNGGVFVIERSRSPVLQGYERGWHRGRETSHPDGIRHHTHAADSIQPPDARHRQLGLSHQRVERRQRDRTGAPGSLGRQVLDERLTFQSLHSCLRIDWRAGPVRTHLRRLRSSLHLREPPSGHGTSSSSRDT